MLKRIKSIIWKLIVIIVLIVLLVLVVILRKNQGFAEWWSTHIGRWYVTSIGNLTTHVPFSLTELLFVSLIALAIFLIIRAIICFVTIRPIKAISKLVSIPLIALMVVVTYSFACGFNYNRKPVDLPFYENEVANEEFDEIYNYFVNDLNACISQLEFRNDGDVKIDVDLPKLSKIVGEAYQIIDSDYYNDITVTAKPMMSSFLYRELQITGVSFSALGEANVNIMSTNAELPFVIAHELAHIKGVMREDDANQVAFYVCLNSDSPLLRFSAYCMYFYQIRNLTKDNLMTDEQLDSLIHYDNKYAKAVNHMIDYWKKHDLLGKIGDFINDLSIKSNGIDEGSASYGGGTESSVEPGTGKLNPSKYQRLFFEKYYRLVP